MTHNLFWFAPQIRAIVQNDSHLKDFHNNHTNYTWAMVSQYSIFPCLKFDDFIIL